MFQRICVFIALAIALIALTLFTNLRVALAADQVVNDCSNDNELFWDLYAMESSGTGGTLTFNCGTVTIVLTRDMPNIARPSTIDGGGQITISANNGFRFLVIQAALTLQNITLTNGYSNKGGLLLVDNGGSLDADNVTLQNSQATDSGGALYVYAGMSANLSNSIVQGNKAVNYGAGIHNDQATVTLNNVTVSSNKEPVIGGGIFTYLGTLTLMNVTLSDNVATDDGGGITSYASAIDLTNVTVSGNAANRGGGIFNASGAVTLTNVTFSDNSGAGGGGFWTNNYGSFKNTILLRGVSGVNCDGIVTNGGFNLSSDDSCNFGAGHDNVNPMLGPLANNGGFTETHLPQTGSPAIDNGTGNGCPSTDQRGFTRIGQGVACDIGAVEVQNVPPTPTNTPTHTPTNSAPPATSTPTPPTCTGKPDKPALLTPANKKKVKGPKIALDWNDPNCATAYDVIVKQGSTTGPKAFKKKNLDLSQATTGDLTKGQTYYWRVTAKNSIGKTNSDWQSFKVK